MFLYLNAKNGIVMPFMRLFFISLNSGEIARIGNPTAPFGNAGRIRMPGVR